MQAVIFVGAQGAGKSTFYHEHFSRTHLRINLDMLNGSRLRESILVRAAVEAKQSFVVDNTNPTKEIRQWYLDIARHAEFDCAAYYFDVTPAEAVERNNRRQNKEKIPEAGIRDFFKKVEIPKIGEGFDKIYIVRVFDGSFTIELKS